MDYGKVTFVSEADGQNFLNKAAAKEIILDNNVLEVKSYSIKEQESHNAFNLLIYNFPPSWNAEKIRNHLKESISIKDIDNQLIIS